MNSSAPKSSRVARIAWLLLVSLYLAAFIAGVPYFAQEMGQLCAVDCPDFALKPGDPAGLAKVGLTVTHYVVFQVAIEIMFGVVCTTIAIVIYWRARHEWIGLLASFTLIAFWLNFLSNGLSALGYALAETAPAVIPIFTFLGALGGLSFIAFLFLFPNGRFFPPWSRGLLIFLLLITLAEPLFILAGWGVGWSNISFVYIFSFLLAICAGVMAQIFRYRRASDTQQRLQTRWIVVGMAGCLVAIFAYSFLIDPWPLPQAPDHILFKMAAVAIMGSLLLLLPITVGIAILRYRLWDIDILIRRTLVYSTLTGLLALIFFGSVTILTSIISAFTAQESPLVLVIATLAIAALFNPLRQRLQNIIDRRFFRRKYDAQRVLAHFALTARDEVGLETLTSELTRVVQETMQPEGIQIMLRPHA